MSGHIFVAEGPSRFVPSGLAAGPWDPRALHGGAPAALIATALEQLEARSGLPIARLTYDFVRPVPMAPLDLSTEVVRAGRRVIELAAELRAGDRVVCTARALRVSSATTLQPGEAAPGEPSIAAPQQAQPRHFSIDGRPSVGFAGAMEMRWVQGDLGAGPATVWMRLGPELIEGAPTTALARLAATADFGNGVAPAVAWSDFRFINPDLTIYLHRPPQGEWIGLSSRTHVDAGGAALAESRVYDETGPVGRALQSLVLERREG